MSEAYIKIDNQRTQATIQTGNATFLLADIQSPINIGQILRTCQAYRHPLVYVYDPRRVFEGHPKEVHDFSCGAIDRLKLERVNDLSDFLDSYPGRKIATYLHKDSIPLGQFEFQQHDLILFGNEYTGLDERIVNLCNEQLVINLPSGQMPKSPSNSPIDSGVSFIKSEGTPCLNVAASAAIIAYQLYDGACCRI